MHYRDLEREKVSILKKKSGNFEGKIVLNQRIVTELLWQLDAIPKAVSDIHTPQADFIINADASESGWGATDGVNPTGGIWSEYYKAYHINYLELKAIHLAIKAYSNLWKGCKHIRIRSDNTTAIAYVSNMGGLVSSSCDRLAKEIWTYCSKRNTWLSAIHIPGKGNNEADYMSRLLNDNTEWKLNSQIFHKILKLFSVKPEIDIFAFHLNYQIPTYVSWNPDKNAYATDAFSISWANLTFYPFPPFSLIGTPISKIRREMAVGIMIISWWATQFWFPMMVPLLQDFPVVLPPNVLTLPSNKGLQHPLYPKIKLLAVHL